MDNWTAGKFLASRGDRKPKELQGWILSGLGLHCMAAPVPDLPMPPIWAIYHIGSGHVVSFLIAPKDDAFRLATEVAHLGDWSFDGLNGWQNVAPQLWDGLQEMMASNPSAMPNVPRNPSEQGAHKVLEERENRLIRRRQRR